MRRGARLAVAVPAIALSGWLAAWVVPVGVADWLYQSSSNDVRTWAASRFTPNYEDWGRVRGELQRAAELAPANPAVHLHLGMLHLMPSGPVGRAQAAVMHLARALESRPTAPYIRANFLLARYQAGLTQAPFARMLVETWRLGPAEPAVQVVVADIGLALWDEVEPEIRVAIGEAIAAGMRHNPVEMLGISQRRGRLFPACGYVQGDKRLAQSVWLKVCGA